ncbi:MAG TPA: alpha/beta hydrolase [Acidimicrobiia bacterium]|nr:alpha/beta hydrolase [Acidimicrobiia bacterium]
MPAIEVDGTLLAYEVIGDDGPPWVITPGGRFSKDVPGIRELAATLAAHGQRVVIWDRPNCGASDVCFTGASESEMQADALAGLLRALELGPTIIMGGSGGARVSLITAVKHPDVTDKLAMVWISGGVYGLMLLATHYCGESLRAAWQGGMEAVVELPEWAEVLERNPRNRDRFLRQDPKQFVATLEQWMLVYVPDEKSPVPGLRNDDLASLSVPTLVFRSGASDPHHTRETSERVAELIPSARLVEPPWPDDEWMQRGIAARVGTGHLFERWPLLAPQLLEFARSS